MKAMVLAAGFGTRLRPYTLVRPKPLFPVLDRPLLLHTLAQLRRSGARQVVVNAHHLREQIAGLVQEEWDVLVQMEEKELGTGGGLRLAMGHFAPQPFLAVNGDIVHDIDLAAVYAGHCASGADVTMVMHDCPRFNNVLVSPDNRIIGFAAAGHQEGRLLAFTGIQVINPQVLAVIPPGEFCNIIDCYAALLGGGGHIRAQVASGHFWTDMGTPADYLELHRSLLRDARPVGLAAAPGGPFSLGRNLFLGPGIVFHDWVAVGSNARIGAGSSLTRVVVWDRAEVAPSSVLSDTIVV
jgi:mannose-1-phosphate guanylyltransferase